MSRASRVGLLFVLLLMAVALIAVVSSGTLAYALALVATALVAVVGTPIALAAISCLVRDRLVTSDQQEVYDLAQLPEGYWGVVENDDGAFLTYTVIRPVSSGTVYHHLPRKVVDAVANLLNDKGESCDE